MQDAAAMPKFQQAPSDKVMRGSRQHIACTEEVTEKAGRGWEGEHSLISLDQVRAETKVVCLLIAQP